VKVLDISNSLPNHLNSTKA